MSDAQTIPNSFQTPNIYVDAALEFITGDECKVLIFAIRHILGWQDRKHQAQISLSRFERGYTSEKGYYFGGCGLSRPTLIAVLDELVRYGLLVKVGKATSKGQWWQLGEAPDWDGLKARHSSRKAANQKRTIQARQKRPRKSRQPAQSVSRTHQPAVNGTDQPAVNDTHQSAVSLINQQRLMRLTEGGQSDLPNETHHKNQHQTQTVNPAAAGAEDNIFALWEKAFGKPAGSALLIDELKDMQAEFPLAWIEEVFREAALSNAYAPLKYSRTILERWRKEGKPPAELAVEPGASKYVTSKWAAFINNTPDDEDAPTQPGHLEPAGNESRPETSVSHTRERATI